MYVREKKTARVVGLTRAGSERLARLMEQYGSRAKTAAVMHAVGRVIGALGEMKMSLRRCTGCRPLTAGDRDGSVVLMLTPRESARLRSAVAAAGVSGPSELIEGALTLLVP